MGSFVLMYLDDDMDEDDLETYQNIIQIGKLLMVVSVLMSAGLAAMGMIMGDSAKAMNFSSLMMLGWQAAEFVISWMMQKPFVKTKTDFLYDYPSLLPNHSIFIFYSVRVAALFPLIESWAKFSW